MTRSVLLSLYLLATLCAAKKDGSLTFVIDDTFSMYNDIEEVKKNVGAIMEIVITKSSQIKDIVLVTFNDPERATFRTNSTERSAVKNALASINVHGGGDCPEYSVTGLKLGLERSLPNSYVYVFTDATAKDENLVEEVKNIAQQKSCQVVFVISPSDCVWGSYYTQKLGAYYEIARATSGQVFKLKSKNQVSDILEYVKNTISGTQTVIGGDVVEEKQQKNIEFVVDDQTEYVLVSTSGENVEMDLVEGPTMAYTKVTWIENAKVMKIHNPVPGKYKVKVYSDTKTSVMVFGRTEFTFEHGFSENEPAPLPDNTEKRPLYGTKYHLSILVDDPGKAVSVETVQLLNMRRQPIIPPMILHQVASDLYATEAFMPPYSTFLIAVVGKGKYSNEFVTRIGKTPIEPLFENKAPSITIKAHAESQKYKSRWILDCKVTGYPKPTVNWQDDTGKILGSDSYESLPYVYGERLLRIAKKSRKYYCEAENEFGTKKSSVEVTVDPPLREIKEQSKFIIEYGESKEILCGISTEFPSQTIWYKRHGRDELEEIKDSETYTLFRGGETLRIENVTSNEEGRYICKVFLNDDPSINKQKTYDLEIREFEFGIPTITIKPKADSYRYKSRIILDCKVTGYPSPRVQWKDEDGKIMESESYENLPIVSGQRLSLDANITKYYYCEASNKFGFKKSRAQVTVDSPLTNVNDETKLIAEYGMSKEITCGLISELATRTIWYKQHDKMDEFEEIKQSGSHTFLNDGKTFKIEKVFANDEGRYICKVTLKDNKNVNKQKIYDIKIREYVPKISNEKTMYYGVTGDKAVRIPCKVTGFPVPNVRWLNEDVAVFNNDKYLIDGNDLVMKKPAIDPHVTEAFIFNYTCEAENALGKDEKEFHLKVGNRVEVDDYGNITYVYILYGTDKKLNCPLTGNVQWYKEGEPKEVAGPWVIEEANYSNDGNYTCRSSSFLGTESHTFIVEVGYAPQFEFNETFLSENWNGNKKYLDCRPDLDSYSSTIQVKWEYNGNPMTEASEIAEAFGFGNYTCQVSNYFGSVKKTFHVTSSDCVINKSESIDHMPLMLSETSLTWPKVQTNNGYWYIKNNKKFRMSCLQKTSQTNSFQNLPTETDIIVSCDHEDKFTINKKTYNFSELQCKERMQPSSMASAKECLHNNTEIIKIGFDLDDFFEVYEVCFDNVNNVPLYTKLVMMKWTVDSEETSRNVAWGNCSVAACCLGQAQLVNARDVRRGPAQLSTINHTFNFVPYWLNCNKSVSELSVVEETIKSNGFSLYKKMTVWTGASQFIASNGTMVPRYLWKVVRFTKHVAMAVVVVNDPAPAPADVLCFRACDLPAGFTSFTTPPYSFTCCLDDFYKIFELPESTFVE